MKKKKTLLAVLGLTIFITLTACDGGGNIPTNSQGESITPTIQPSEDHSSDEPSSPSIQPSDETSSSPEIEDETPKIAEYISIAITKLDEIVKPVINKIPDGDLKAAIQLYYDRETQHIRGISDIETAKVAATMVVEDTKAFVKDTLKPLAITKLNSAINPLIENISHEGLKNSVQGFYDKEISRLNALESLDEVSTTFEEVLNDTKEFIKTETEKVIVALKNKALEELDPLVKAAIAKISDEDLKAAIQVYYDNEAQRIRGINDLETAETASTMVVEDTKAFVKDTLKPLAITKLNSIINPLIENITHEGLKNSVHGFYDKEISRLNALESLDEVSTTFEEILNDTKEFIKTETEKVIVALKNKALEELDPYVTALIDKIPYETLKSDTQAFYNEEKKKLEAIDSFDGFEPCVKEIKEDLEEYALTEAKKIAISKLEEVVEEGIAKLPNPEFKEDLTEFSKKEFAKLNAVIKIEDVPTTLSTVISEIEEHVRGLLVNTIKEYITRLTAIEKSTAYDYLPAAMHPEFSSNIVDASSINYDFTSFTNVEDINQAGYGEQWQMVVENINQSVAMANVFNVAQTALNAAGTAVDIYITNSYAEEMSYSFEGEGYTGKFEFKDSKLEFNVNLTELVTVPGFGSVKPVIKMEYDLTKEAKGMYISLGESYKVLYVITENGYEMATTYGLTIAGKAASRTSYLSITKNSGKTIGHIYEYTTVEGSDMIKACADFYVQNGYVSVVGNKSSGMTGFDGYINELYSASEGRMLGYEVREELTIVGITGTYNTLWFNLWDIEGIDSVKVMDKTEANKSKLSQNDVYLNGSSTLLAPTYNSKIIIGKTSRKYDIEYRTRYYYTYDAEKEAYICNAVEVPMMFIQEGDNYQSFSEDILKDNEITASVSLPSVHLNKILADYDTLIDVFIENKDAMSSEIIVEFLKQYE